MQTRESIRPVEGKLGVLLIGLGAIATTFAAGVMLCRRGLARPVGSLTQLGRVRLGGGRHPLLSELVALAPLSAVEFGAWDIFSDDAFTAATRAEVLSRDHLNAIADELRALVPMPGVFFPDHLRRLRGDHVKPSLPHADLVRSLRDDIAKFRSDRGVSRCIALWCGSTETFIDAGDINAALPAFEAAIGRNDPRISPSQLYAYACLLEGVGVANASPNAFADTPALLALAERQGVPVAGRDLKTGQTLMKTVIAPGLKARMLGLSGWFSTNILGNRDGEVLADPDTFKRKEQAKLSVLEPVLEPALYPELYGNLHHQVRINYYPPRGDQKESWDNIDLFGWLGYPMQMKIDFMCRDSILAAPLLLDLALWLDLAQRAGSVGAQEWLAFYFKAPTRHDQSVDVGDLFQQVIALKNQVRLWAGEPASTEHYD